MKATYPGTFDPVTIGHVDIIERASKLFDHLTVLVMNNPNKVNAFSAEERKELIEKSISHLENVDVVIGEGLTVEYTKSLGAKCIVRGIRAVTDYEYELQQVSTNMVIDSDVETMLMISKPKYAFLSSSVVKELAHLGGDISEMVPKEIVDTVKERLK